MFDFVINTFFSFSNSLVSSLPDFPSLPTFQNFETVDTFLSSAFDIMCFVFPVRLIAVLLAFSEAVLHYRVLQAWLHKLLDLLPFF